MTRVVLEPYLPAPRDYAVRTVHAPIIYTSARDYAVRTIQAPIILQHGIAAAASTRQTSVQTSCKPSRPRRLPASCSQASLAPLL